MWKWKAKEKIQVLLGPFILLQQAAAAIHYGLFPDTLLKFSSMHFLIGPLVWEDGL